MPVEIRDYTHTQHLDHRDPPTTANEQLLPHPAPQQQHTARQQLITACDAPTSDAEPLDNQ